MKITIVSLDNWGFNNHIKEVLEKNGHQVNHIDFNKFVYKYPNSFYKIYNFFLKLLFKKNIKAVHFGKKIIEKLQDIGEIQDIILTIKGDFIDPKAILEFKKYSKKSIGFFNDSTSRSPRIIRVIPCFDKVFSFEKADCNKYNLNLATNWIYNYSDFENEKFKTNNKYQVFNITSKDKRLPTLSKIAHELKSKQITYKIIVFDKKHKGDNVDIEYISKHLSLIEINEYINNSQVLLDINRNGQSGLTFRVFESLGLHKKLITTNTDIKNYDFYDPNNILIIDEKHPEIAPDFFKSEYKKIPDNIFQKYTLNGWINNVLFEKYI
jgi:hypothetical protein